LSRILSWNLVHKLDERSDKVLFPNRLQHHASLIVFAIVFVSLSHDVACPARLSCFFVPRNRGRWHGCRKLSGARTKLGDGSRLFCWITAIRHLTSAKGRRSQTGAKQPTQPTAQLST
jgi:hypothetical protein